MPLSCLQGGTWQRVEGGAREGLTLSVTTSRTHQDVRLRPTYKQTAWPSWQRMEGLADAWQRVEARWGKQPLRGLRGFRLWTLSLKSNVFADEGGGSKKTRQQSGCRDSLAVPGAFVRSLQCGGSFHHWARLPRIGVENVTFTGQKLKTAS